MKQPLELRFLGMEASPAVEAAARDKAAKLTVMFGAVSKHEILVRGVKFH